MAIDVKELNHALKEQGMKIVPLQDTTTKDQRRGAAIGALNAVKKLDSQEAKLALEMALKMLKAS